MILSSYTKPIEQLMIEQGISFSHRSWSLRKDGTYDYEKGHFRAYKYKQNGDVVEGFGDTPRDAVIELFKKLE